MIELFYSPGSCSLAPHIVLREIGVPFELRKFSTADGSNHSGEYRRVNPKGYIPALRIDGFTLTENSAILIFLARRFPDAQLWPEPGSKTEAKCLEWLVWCSNTVHPAFALLWRPERFALHEADFPAVKEKGKVEVPRLLGVIDNHFSQNEFAAGDRYTPADAYTLAFYRWGFTIAGFPMRERFASFARFADRLSKRAAVREALKAEHITLEPA